MTFTAPLRIIDLHDDGFHPLVDVSIFGKSFTLVLDTGASKTAFDHTMLVNEGLQPEASSRLSSGLGTNTMTSFTTIVEDLHIGELHVAAFEVAVLDLSAINIAYSLLDQPNVLGVLGGDLLMRYKAVIDYGKSSLSLDY